MTSDSGSALTPERAGALRGIRVLDFGHYIAGPLAGMLLADQGAEVIKVERPQGDPARIHPAFAIWNRGKQSVVIDLHTPEGQSQAQALMRSADVVIENFRPGVAERLGIGYEALAAQHPRPSQTSRALPHRRTEPGLGNIPAARPCPRRPARWVLR